MYLNSLQPTTNTSNVVIEDAEDHEIFDINDFTTASDWERFILVSKILFFK